MNLLIDTHVVLWWLLGSPELSENHESAIGSSTNLAYVSAVTIWEIEMKAALGKLKITADYPGALREEGFHELPIAWKHSALAGSLPPLHRDPFDRMLVAQALHEDLVIVTADADIRRYDVRVLE